MKFKDILKIWWRKTPATRTWKYNTVVPVSSMSEIPDGDLKQKIYLISRGEKNRWLVLDCPQGHGKRIEVNLMQSSNPVWELTQKHGKVSLYPSVAVASNQCNCHFWLKNNIAYEAFWI